MVSGSYFAAYWAGGRWAMKHRTPLFAGMLALSVLAGFAAQTAKTSGAEELRAADQQWMSAFSAKNLDKSVAFVAPAASVLPPNAPIAIGPEAIRKSFAGFFALRDLQITWTPTTAEASHSGDLGYTQGTYQMSFTAAEGRKVSDRGKYVTVWKRQPDKSWKVVADIFNSDLPPAPMTVQQ
jgi:ketosteroid isomerase-like protein